MKKLIIITVIAAAVILSGCVMNKLDTSHKSIVLKEAVAGNNLVVDVVTGGQWSSRMQAGPFIFNVLPQSVFWIEDRDGRLIETLYVTGADFRKMRHAAKSKDGELFYSECLPYWSSKLKTADKTLPSKSNPYPDTVTSATPMADFTLKTSIESNSSNLMLFAEVNKSDDVNAAYSKENNGWAGQPSLIYSADLGSLSASGGIKLRLAGHGGKLGDEPALYTDLSGIDTALNQIKDIKVWIE